MSLTNYGTELKAEGLGSGSGQPGFARRAFLGLQCVIYLNWGANAGVSTQVPEVYSYVRSVGAFIVATVEGSVLLFDFVANRDLYGISDPLKMEAKEIPGPALRFSCAVARATGAPAGVCG